MLLRRKGKELSTVYEILSVLAGRFHKDALHAHMGNRVL